MEIIDLSQEIYHDMPVFSGMPSVRIQVHATHEEWEGIQEENSRTPSALALSLGDHTGSHVDALSHMGREYQTQTIDTMPLSMFYTSGICLDVSHKQAGELIEIADLEAGCVQAGVQIQAGDTVLLYTDHYRRCFGTAHWPNGPGLSEAATTWLGTHRIAAFGVEPMAPGVRKVSNKAVHRICGALGFTHYENLINLHLLVGKGRFRFIGFPLKIKGGTGSPVRAVAIFE